MTGSRHPVTDGYCELVLNFIRWGSGPKRILLLHGLSSAAPGWWRVGSDLARRGWTVTAPDLLDHGRSPSSVRRLLEEHAAAVMELGGAWDAVLGHSLGGAVALVAAARDEGWAKGLVLQDPALVMPEDVDQVVAWLLEEHDRVTPESLARAFPHWHPQDVTAKADALAPVTRTMVEETIRANQPWNLIPLLARIEVPISVLGSDPAVGGILPVSLGEWIGEQPGMEYRLLEGAEHSVHRDVRHYERYLAALVGVLERLPTLSEEHEGAAQP